MKECTDRTIGVVDEQGNIIACTDLSLIGQSLGNNLSDIFSMSDINIINGFTCRVIGSRIKLENVCFVKGTDQVAESVSGVLAVSLGALKEYNDEK